MDPVLFRRVFVAAIFACLPLQAHAACSGAAPAPALQGFTSDPAAWVKAHGQDADLGAQMQALAAAAVNTGDKGFGAALGAALGLLSADQGTPVGKALGQLVNSCSDPHDPGDAADKKYISANISPAMIANANANTAYGAESGPQSASTSGGAGSSSGGSGSSSGGTGVGGQTGSGGPAGGPNTGSGPTPLGSTTTASGTNSSGGASGSSTIP